MLIEIKIPVYGSRSGCAITIDNGTSFHPVIYGNSSIITSHFAINDKILLMYDSTTNGNVYGTIDGSTTTYIAPITGVWRIMNLYIDGNTYTSAYCDSPAFTTRKMANCSGYFLLPKSQIHVIMANTNTAASALTLDINDNGAKPIYINGIASSSSNYNLPRGSYLVYYDGTNYYFRTDGAITGDLIGNASTATALTTSAGSATQPIYFSNGKPVAISYTIAKSVPSNAVFTDINVRQQLYSSNYNLPLLMSYQTNTNTTMNIDNVTFRNNNIYANPSTGMIASTSSKIGEHVTLQYDSTNECLNFVFT